MQNYTYLHSNVYLSLKKSATVSFLANIWSQRTCQYDLIMNILDALQLQREADDAFFDDKNFIL